MSLHTLTATVPHGPTDLGAEVELEITFEYRAGSPDTPPAYSHGGLPADPPEIEFVSCKAPINSAAFADLEQQQLNDIAERWLESGAGREAALREVADDNDRAREYAAELRGESNLSRRQT